MCSILTILVILHVNNLLAPITYSEWIGDCYIEDVKKDIFLLSKQLFTDVSGFFFFFPKRLLL